ncbi:hypothetical protein [Ralstonia pseudosolanacearum]|uniref:hypothetical protein n=1 Tax=Ralstonia pseudosolanacearum TaxID=1310165 RepID=UPI003525E00C
MVVWFGLVWFGLVWFGLVWFGLVWFGLVWFGLVLVLVLVLVVHPWFRPLAGPTHFLCLAKESKQRKARPRWRPPP